MSDDVKIVKLMSAPVLTIREAGTIREAITVMSANQVGSLLVTRQGAEVGILTDKDIFSKVIAQNRDVHRITVGEAMSSPLITVAQDTTGEEALRTMVKYHVRRLPVTENGVIIGIFSTADVTKLVEAHNVLNNKDHAHSKTPRVWGNGGGDQNL